MNELDVKVAAELLETRKKLEIVAKAIGVILSPEHPTITRKDLNAAWHVAEPFIENTRSIAVALKEDIDDQIRQTQFRLNAMGVK